MSGRIHAFHKMGYQFANVKVQVKSTGLNRLINVLVFALKFNCLPDSSERNARSLLPPTTSSARTLATVFSPEATGFLV